MPDYKFGRTEKNVYENIFLQIKKEVISLQRKFTTAKNYFLNVEGF